MVLYCEHQLLGVKKKKQNPVSTFLWVKLDPLLLEAIFDHICVKALKCKVFHTITVDALVNPD